MPDVAYFTICSTNYLPTAKILLSSLRKKTNQDIYLILCDTKRDLVDNFLSDIDIKMIYAEDIGINDFQDLIFRYSILELNTAIKPFVFNKLFQEKYAKVFYFDPDIIIEDSLNVFEEILDTQNAIVTPHILSPYKDNKSPSLQEIGNSGTYNLGFLGLSKVGTEVFIEYWMDKCKTLCFSDIKRNLFTDQKFCDFLPTFVNKTHIYYGPEANIAYWNLHEREIEKGKNCFLSNGKNVMFFHFSGLVFNDQFEFLSISKHENRFENNVSEPLKEKIGLYLQELKQNTEEFKKLNINISYGFNEVDGISLTQFHRNYMKEVEKRDGPLNFNSINKDWFSELSVEIREFTNLPRVLMGLYLSRQDLRDAFDITNEEGVNSFYKWIYTSSKNNEIPKDFNDLVPEKILISSSKKVEIKSFLLRQLKKLSRRFPSISSNRILLTLKDPVRRYLSGQAYNEKDSGKNNLGLFSPLDTSKFNKRGINLFGYFDSNTGVAKGVKLMENILKVCDFKVSKYSVMPGDNSIIKEANTNQKKHDISLFHVNADQTPNCIPYIPSVLKNSYKIGYWAWELEKFPSKYLKSGSLLNDLWVPSNFIANSIERSYDFSPKVIPHPISKHSIGLFGLTKKLDLKKRFYVSTFFDLDSYVTRKNPIASIMAFEKAAKLNDKFLKNASLILKISGKLGKVELLDTIDQIKKESSLDIIVIDEILSENEMSGLRNLTNIFISLHRSEGFGLNLIENMSAGNLVIATNYSGNVDFMNDKNSLLVDYNLVPVRRDEYPEADGQFWANPIIEDAALKILWAYENESKAKKICEDAKKYVYTNYSLEAVSQKVVKAINAI